MKLTQLILEGIVYSKPNFNHEWEEAIRYPEFKEMGKDSWIEIANKGYVTTYSKISDELGNVDLNFVDLEAQKKYRFLDAYNKGTVEMPIAVKFSDTDYDLVAGNTRLAGLVRYGIDPKIWIVDLSDLQENYVLQNLENKFDIDLDLHDDGKALTLSRIVIPKDKRGQGIGSKVMNLITQYADAQNKPIYLTPSKDFGATSTGRLEQFYKQFGFKKKDKSDFSTRETMVREPQISENYSELEQYRKLILKQLIDSKIGKQIRNAVEDKVGKEAVEGVYIIGSVLDSKKFHEESDIDIAVLINVPNMDKGTNEKISYELSQTYSIPDGGFVDISIWNRSKPLGKMVKLKEREYNKKVSDFKENYADGKVKGKSRPGRVKRSGASCKGSVSDLRAKAKKYGGEKGKMYHWCANMKGGKKK